MINSDDSKYPQQHLANERTYLAWVRTIISILGVGFVTITLHFELTAGIHRYADLLIRVIGLTTLVLAFIVALFSAHSYLRKRDGINNNSFRSTATFVVFLSSSIIIMLIAMGIYLITVY